MPSGCTIGSVSASARLKTYSPNGVLPVWSKNLSSLGVSDSPEELTLTPCLQTSLHKEPDSARSWAFLFGDLQSNKSLKGMGHALGNLASEAGTGHVKGDTQKIPAGMEGGSLFKISALQ